MWALRSPAERACRGRQVRGCGRRETIEHRRRLELARDPHLCAVGNGKRSNLLALEPDPTGGRREMARDHAYEGGFAGAVWPDHAANRARLEREVDIVIGDQAAETLGQSFGPQQLSSWPPPPASPPNARPIAPAIPPLKADDHHDKEDSKHELPIFGNDGGEVV